MMLLDSPVVKLSTRAYQLLARIGNVFGSLFLLLFRLDLGIQFFVSGRGKFVNHSDIVSYFTSLHIPFPEVNAWFVAAVELLGGIFLIGGLAARPVGLILMINMTVAYLVSDDRASVIDFIHHPIAKQDAFVQASPFFFLLVAIITFGFGAGLFSLDRLIEWRLGKKETADKHE